MQWLEDMHVVIVLGSVGGCTGRSLHQVGLLCLLLPDCKWSTWAAALRSPPGKVALSYGLVVWAAGD